MAASANRLVVFDVEGVLIPKNRFFFQVGRTLGWQALLKILFYGFLYEVGVFKLKTALKRIFILLKGTELSLLMEHFDGLPLMPTAVGVFAELKRSGYKTALISSGLPTMTVEKLAMKLQADYAVGFQMGIEDNVLTGEIWGEVIEKDGKKLVLEEILSNEKIDLNQSAVVADDRNNNSIFLKNIRKIGYNPDFIIKTKADNVLTGRLSKVVPVIQGKPRRRHLPSRSNVLREAIHASGLFMAVMAIFLGVPTVVSLIYVIVVIYTVSEITRIRGGSIPLITTITRHAASQSELSDFTLAPVYFAVGILLTLLFFPMPVSSVAIAVFTFGDSTASLIGEVMVKTSLSYNKSKSLEGSISGFFFAFLAAAFFVAPWIALVAAAVAMVVESLPLPVNDNLSVPLFTGLVLMLFI